MDWRRITILFFITFLSDFSVKSRAQASGASLTTATASTARTVICPHDPPGLENLNFESATCQDIKLGATCEVHCKAGFNSGNHITETMRCQDDGTWSIPRTCSKITCPAIPVSKLNTGNWTACESKPMYLNESCYLNCKQGYEKSGWSVGSVECRLSSNKRRGKWVGYKNKICIKKKCRSLQAIADATNDCSDIQFESKCEIQCNTGYEFSPKQTTKALTCRLKGDHLVLEPISSSTIGECRKIACLSSLPKTRRQDQHLRSALDFQCGKSIGERCEVLCEQGYEDQVSPTTYVTCTLSSSNLIGIWVGYSSKTCTPKNCQPLQEIDDATNDCSDVQFESTCQIQCEDGYEFSPKKSTKTMTCSLEEGQLVLKPTSSTTIGECRRKACAAIQLSRTTTGNCRTIPFGSTCEIRCIDGHEFFNGLSSKKITCQLINKQVVWEPVIEGIVRCHAKKCKTLQPIADSTNDCSNVRFRSRCRITCNDGYEFSRSKSTQTMICGLKNSHQVVLKPTTGATIGECGIKIVGNEDCEYWSSGAKSRGKKDAESQCKQIFGENSVLAMPKSSDERNYANSALSYLVGASNGDDSALWDDGDDINRVIFGAGNCITLQSKSLRADNCSYLRKFICERPTDSYDPCSANPCKSGGTCIPYGCSFRCQCESNFFGHTCEKGPFDISIETPKTSIARGESVSISYTVKSNAGKAGFTLYVNGEKQREVRDITNTGKIGSYITKRLTNDIYISGKALLEAQPDSPVYKCIKVTVQNADVAVNITKDVCDGTVFDITWKGLGTIATSSISYDIYLGDKLKGKSSSTRYKLQGLTTGTNYDIKVVPHLQGCTNKELFKVHKMRTSMGPPNASSVHVPETNDRSISNCTITWNNDRPKSIGGFKINIIEKIKGNNPELVASEQNFFEDDVDEMEYSYHTNPNSIYEVMVGTKPLRICGDVPVWSNRTFGCRTDSAPPKEVRVPMIVATNSDRGTVSMELSSVDERNGQVSCYLVIVQKMNSSFASENSTSEPITDIDQLVQANQTIRDGDSFVTLALPRFEGSTDLILGDGRMTCCDMSNSSVNCDKERTRTKRAIGTVVRGENRQLDPDANYRHYVVVSTPTASKDSVLMASPMSDSWSPDGDDRGNNALVIALPVISAILLVLVVLAIIIVRRKNTKGKVHAVPADHALMQIQRRPNQDDHSLSEEAIIDVDVPVLNLDNIVERHLSIHSFQLANLYQTMENKRADEDMLFLEEFKGDIKKMIAQCKLTSDIAQLPANRTTKNRYTNIVPYDNSRVVLEKTPGNEFSDFINAAYIDGYKCPRKFIATQGPEPQTIGDFWRMVWEQECYIITVLTNLVEKKKVKCAQYWPEEETTSKKYDSINVTFMETTTYGDYVRRKFEVSRDGKTRTIFQFHFIAWPDHGIPNTTSSILRFHKSVICSQPSSAGPIVVHCSAGVGRTGTFIALDILSEQISETEEINICALVGKMRTNRTEMVQTLDQYIYIHKLVLELYNFGETDVEVSGLNAAYNNLRRINEQRSEIEQEFAMLDYFIPINTDHETAQNQINKHLNRNSAVLPYDHNAVFIQMTPTDRSLPYYNASEIASYHANDKFIAAQTPDENSIGMFWRTVFDNHVSMIVSLCETKEEANYCYWPKRSEVVKHGSVSVKTIEEATDMGCVERKFEVTSKEQKISVSQICYGNWAENVVPASSGIVLEIFARVEKHHQTLGNSGKKTTLVHCSDGSGRSGTFCAISNLIERLKNENRVDVFRIVKDLRDQRPKMVQSLEQYEFCYQAVNEFLQSFDLYGNFQ